jgi:hypothetical protein
LGNLQFISENMDPRELLDFLNEYLSGMVESVLQHHGVVDKFIGDAIMAVFGAPLPEPDDPLHAVCAALAMREKLAKINEGFVARGLPEIRTGIGLHPGQVVAVTLLSAPQPPQGGLQHRASRFGRNARRLQEINSSEARNPRNQPWWGLLGYSSRTHLA